AAFAKAAHVTKLSFVNNRLIPNAIEPRAANAQYSRADDSYTLYVTSQNPHVERLLMTAFVLGLPEHKVRVVAPDVGGGFGSKIYLYAEETALVWASKRVGRPIKWTAERSESFLTDAHGRDHVSTAELRIDPPVLRRRTFIRKFPYATRVGLTYDTGDYEATLKRVLEIADVNSFAARKAASAKQGLLRGIGYSCYIEACGIAPSNIAGALGARAGLFEAGEVRVHPTGKVTVFTGSHSHGQGH